jgi:glycosyltransferase involved in cell wall biosynthesis
MKILFLCGSLEPGRDGVGDYTRRLSGELIRQGHRAAIIALNDRYVDTITQTEQESDGTNTSVLRLPVGLSNKERYKNTDRYINDFDPEWLSLQFVIYAFQKRGLPFGLGRRLAKIGKGRKWHIMFHELWVGAYYSNKIKTYIYRYLQRIITKRLIMSLNPIVIHTHLSLYKFRLNELGYNVNLLPLFANIPICENQTKVKFCDNKYTFIVFGTIHPNKPFLLFVNELKKIESQYHYIFKINFVGRNGNELKNWIKILKENDIEYKVYGKMDISEISKLLSESDIGVTSNPSIYAGKSGTVAAMIEHGLPVICISESPRMERGLKEIYNPLNLLLFDQGCIDMKLFTKKDKIQIINNLQQKANDFIDNLL